MKDGRYSGDAQLRVLLVFNFVKSDQTVNPLSCGTPSLAEGRFRGETAQGILCIARRSGSGCLSLGNSGLIPDATGDNVRAKVREYAMNRTTRMTRLALLIAAGGALHWIESMFAAPFAIPGAKMGLANVVTLYAVIMWGFSDGIYVAVGRTLFGSLLGGTFATPAFAMSLSGGLIAACVMAAVYFLAGAGAVGTSVAGAVSHNLTQLAVFAVITRYAGVFVYSPYLILMAIPAGLLTGLTASYLARRGEQIMPNDT